MLWGFVMFFLLLSCALFSTAHAQKVVVPEPEFINSYCVLTSDSTFDVLPKESGKVEKHQSKFSKFSKIASAASNLGLAGGLIGASTGSLSGLEGGLRVMGSRRICNPPSKNDLTTLCSGDLQSPAPRHP